LKFDDIEVIKDTPKLIKKTVEKENVVSPSSPVNNKTKTISKKEAVSIKEQIEDFFSLRKDYKKVEICDGLGNSWNLDSIMNIII